MKSCALVWNTDTVAVTPVVSCWSAPTSGVGVFRVQVRLPDDVVELIDRRRTLYVSPTRAASAWRGIETPASQVGSTCDAVRALLQGERAPERYGAPRDGLPIPRRLNRRHVRVGRVPQVEPRRGGATAIAPAAAAPARRCCRRRRHGHVANDATRIEDSRRWFRARRSREYFRSAPAEGASDAGRSRDWKVPDTSGSSMFA